MAKVDIGVDGTFAGSGRSVVRTSTGDLYAVVVDSGGELEVWYSSDGSSWAKKGSSGVSDATNCSVAIDSGDILHIAYTYSSDNVGYNTFDTLDGGDQDDAFNTAELGNDLGASAGGVAIAIDSNDIPHIAYYKRIGEHYKDGNLMHAYLDGKWIVETIDSGKSVGREPSIALTSDDKIGIAYYNQGDYHLKYAFYDGNRWSLETVEGGEYDGRGVGLEASLVFDSNDVPHIAAISSLLHESKVTGDGIETSPKIDSPLVAVRTVIQAPVVVVR